MSQNPCPISAMGPLSPKGGVSSVRLYEVMYIIPVLEEEQTQAVIERYKSLLTANGAVIEHEEIWGKRRLAYEIDDHREGYYVVTIFRGEPAVVKELDRVMRISDDVIRHMIVTTELPKPKPAPEPKLAPVLRERSGPQPRPPASAPVPVTDAEAPVAPQPEAGAAPGPDGAPEAPPEPIAEG